MARIGRRFAFLTATLLVALTAHPVYATNHLVHIKQVSASRNNDTNVQFVQMEMESAFQNAWSHQSFDAAPASESRAMLQFFDAGGNLTFTLKFPSDPPGAGNLQVLIATSAFAALAGAPAPEFTIPNGSISPTNGKVCFKSNPANLAFFVNECLSYGSGFTGSTETSEEGTPFGSPAPALPATGGFQALRRTVNTNHNSDFTLVNAIPTNNAGATFPAGPPTTIAINAGNNQSALAGSTLSTNPSVIVTDADGIPVSGVGVTFNVASGGGSRTGGSQTTSAQGIATVGSWTLGAAPGTNTLTATPGVALSGTGPCAGGVCTFTATGFSGPTNDMFASRITLAGLAATTATTNTGATTEGSENLPCGAIGRTLWWTWTAPGTGNVTIDTIGSNFDTVLAAYTGNVFPLTLRQCNDDAVGVQSRITFAVTAGTVLQIQAGGFSSSQGNITLNLVFTQNPPTITNFDPTSGPFGTSVTINGTNFIGATDVHFFNDQDAGFVVNSDTMISATVPLGATTGAISVTTPGGTIPSAGNFTVTIPEPTITSFSPSSGLVGTSVTINGTNFTGATAVRFNGTAATSFNVNSAIMITATVPNGATTGQISVETPGGTANSALNFTVNQVARTFASVSGNDANNCANVATPCRTLDAAIGQVGAGGTVMVLRTGPYGGATIPKAVTISVPTGVIAFTASSFIINAGASDVVVLRGLTIKALTAGTGTGVVVNSAAAVYVENTVLDGWNKGIEVLGPGQLFVTDSTIRNSTAAGVRLAPASGTARASIDRSRIERTSAGCGADFQMNGSGAVKNSSVTGNQDGLCKAGTGTLELHRSLSANNGGSGLRVTGAGFLRVGHSIVTNNNIGLENAGGTLESLGNNLVQGNGTDTSGTITVVSGK
jgi:hypothetical protein